jgi:hypothetical protein
MLDEAAYIMMARKEREREREKGAKGWSPNSPFKA